MAEPKDADLRFNVTLTLMRRIDALVQAKGFAGRGDLLTPLIEAFVTKEIHEATLLLRMAGINPLATEPVGTQPGNPRSRGVGSRIDADESRLGLVDK